MAKTNETANVQFRVTKGKRKEIQATARRLGYPSVKAYLVALHTSARAVNCA